MPDEPQWGPATTYRARPSLRRGTEGNGGQPPVQRAGQRYADDGRGAPQGPPQQPVRPQQPPVQRAPRRPVSPARRRGLVRLVVLLVVLAVVVYPVALGVTAYTAVTRTGPMPTSTLPVTPGQTILLVGSDSREGLTRDQKVELGTGDAAGGRTDTIILLHRPANGGPAVLMSIPRDSYVAIPGHGHNKVNAAYAFGGPSLMVTTVEQATGIRVDGYVETGLAGFAGMVDAVGGVTLCPTKAIKDPKADLDVQAGCQTMDGPTALGYARSRDEDVNGDLGRAQRQRAIIGAVAKAALSPGVLLDPFRSFPLAHAGGAAISADDGFGPGDLLGFVRGVRAVSSGDAVSLNVPVASANRRTSAGLVVDWNTKQADAVFEAIRTDDTASIRAIAAAEATGTATSASS